jgi:hypothetical protein
MSLVRCSAAEASAFGSFEIVGPGRRHWKFVFNLILKQFTVVLHVECKKITIY